MKRIIILLSLFGLLPAGLHAEAVGLEQARQKAMQVLGTSQAMAVDGLTTATRAGDVEPAYYLFTAPQGGYAIITGEDSFPDVVAYSLRGKLVEGRQLPPAMQWLLDLYAQCVEAVRMGEADAPEKLPATRASVPVVEPLVPTSWGQDAPYNLLCPDGCPSGCVATATTQIMYFHRWPEQGTGQVMTYYNSQPLMENLDEHRYDWDAMRADGFQWWKERIRGAAKRYDVVRIDHFRAISSYWVVPRGERTARGGHWAPGPGPALLQALHTAAPELELIAEDLGTIDDDVRRLVARSGCPGMRVLLFGFDPSGTSEHRPDRVRAHSVCYVGTHDNAPAAAWAALGGADADYAMRCLGVYDVARLPEALLRAGMGSRAELFIAQMQDVLGLGAESRMNTPGTASGNWVWRLLPGQADAQTAARLRARTQAACRI